MVLSEGTTEIIPSDTIRLVAQCLSRLKETITNRLMVFERKVLRKIFGPTNENGIWQIKTNQDLDKIIKHKNIINFIRAQRLG
jgi:hypothetical protein